MWVTRERSGSVIHMITGGVFENSPWRPVVQRLVRPIVVVEREPPADAQTCFARRAVRLDEGEWRGTSQPRALSEPDVNLSIHPAPIIQPLAPGSSGRTCPGCAA